MLFHKETHYVAGFSFWRSKVVMRPVADQLQGEVILSLERMCINVAHDIDQPVDQLTHGFIIAFVSDGPQSV